MNRPFTGYHMAAILIAFFGVVIGVNLLMARYALSTFGGIVVENSYVASQEFNTWLDEAAAEKSLGWAVHIQRQPDGKLLVDLAGAPAGTILELEARHPLGRLPDMDLTFGMTADGKYLSHEALPLGRWILRIEARAGETVWRDEEDFT